MDTQTLDTINRLAKAWEQLLDMLADEMKKVTTGRIRREKDGLQEIRAPYTELLAALQRGGGIYKRIDEHREIYQLLHKEVPGFLTDKFWLTAQWAATDDFLVGLVEALDPDHHLGPIPFKACPPAPWPFPRPRPYDAKGGDR